MALVRVTFAPFGVTSYLLGVTSISVGQFLIGTSGYIINVVMQVFIGCSLFSMNIAKTTNDWKRNTVSDIVLAIEILLSAVITGVMGYYAKKLVQEKLEVY